MKTKMGFEMSLIKPQTNWIEIWSMKRIEKMAYFEVQNLLSWSETSNSSSAKIPKLMIFHFWLHIAWKWIRRMWFFCVLIHLLTAAAATSRQKKIWDIAITVYHYIKKIHFRTFFTKLLDTKSQHQQLTNSLIFILMLDIFRIFYGMTFVILYHNQINVI